MEFKGLIVVIAFLVIIFVSFRKIRMTLIILLRQAGNRSECPEENGFGVFTYSK